MTIIYRVGDLVYDVDIGIGIITRIMLDDNEFDGLVYLVWWASLDQTSVEFGPDLTPHWLMKAEEETNEI